jgi:hypothetical protein
MVLVVAVVADPAGMGQKLALLVVVVVAHPPLLAQAASCFS